MQLKSAQAELKQARTALQTMERSDGSDNYGLSFPKITHVCVTNKRIFVSIVVIILVVHWELTLCFLALEAAARMQKQITAKREQKCTKEQD